MFKKMTLPSRFRVGTTLLLVLVVGALVWPTGHPKLASADTHTATDVLGQTNFSNGFVNGVAPSAQSLWSPADTAWDAAGHRLFVADEANNRVLVYNLDSSNHLIDHTADYVLGQSGFTSNFDAVTAHTMESPVALTYDTVHQRLFVAEEEEILVFDLSNGITNGMDASYVIGKPDFTTTGYNINQSDASGIVGMAYDMVSQRLFVSSSWFNRVLVFDLSSGITNGMAASYVLGQPDFTSNSSGTTASTFSSPQQVSYDPARHYLFVADEVNNRVLVFDLSSGITNGMAASYVLGTTSFTDKYGGLLFRAYGVNYDSTNQRLFVSSLLDNRIAVFDLSSGITNGMAASYVLGQPDFTSSSSGGGSTGISYPEGVNFDAYSGQLTVVDNGNNRVLIFDLSSGITNGMAASDVLGQADFSTSYANGSPQPTNSGLSVPSSLALDKVHHRLFVVDTANQRVLVYNLDNSNHLIDHTADYVLGQPDFTSQPYCQNTAASLCNPRGLAYDSSHDRLFVGDYSSVLVFDLSSGITNGMAASYILGQSDFTRNGYGCTAASATTVCQVGEMAYDSTEDRLFVADTSNDRAMVFDLSSGITNGMAASYVLGQPDFTTTTAHCTWQGPVSASELCSSNAVAYDSSRQELFISDTNNGRVLVFDLSGGITNDMAASYTLNATGTMEIDALSHMLYVADSSRVLVFDLSGGITNDMAASDVIGQPDLTTNVQHCASQVSLSADAFCTAYGLALDATNHILYVADQANNRVLSFDMTLALTTPSLDKGVTGQTYSQTITSLYGVGAVTYSVSAGSLPNGLSLNAATGEISGTPTSPGTATFTIQATDSVAATVAKQYSIEVAAPVSLTTTSLPDGQSGVYYIQTLAATGQAPFTYTLTSGTLPSGVSLAGSGVLVGTPSQTGDFTFTIQVTDGNNTTDSKQLSLHIALAPLSVTSGTMPSGAVNHPYSFTMGASGGVPPYIFTVASGSLPAGLSMDSGGVISGTPHTAGDSTFVVQATDNLGATATASFTVHIASRQPYAASDELGEIDANGAPVWNSDPISSNSSYSGGGGPNNRGFQYPLGTTLDPVHHRLFVASACDSRILEYDLDAQNNLLDRLADHVLGQSSFSTSGTHTTASGLSCPYAAAYDAVHDRLFVVDDSNSRVVVYDLSGGITDGMAASYVLGQPDFTSAGNSTTSQNSLSYPTSAVYDPTTNFLYVADGARVLVYDLSHGITNGMAASYVLGQPDFTSSACATTQTGMAFPYGITLDTVHHRLFVTDGTICSYSMYNGRVLVYDLSHGITNGMAASYVLGQPDFTSTISTNAAPTQSNLVEPLDVMYDSSRQRLFVYDDLFNRILVYDLSHGITNGMAAQAVIGQSDFESNNYACVPSQTTLCDAEDFGGTFDESNNRLYIADSSDNRVMIYQFVTLTTASLPNAATGSPYNQAFSSVNGQGTPSYSVVSGILPPGLSLNAATGVLSGTPTTHGTYNFTVQVKDDNGSIGYFTDSHSYTIVVTGADVVSAGGSQSGNLAKTTTARATAGPTTPGDANGSSNAVDSIDLDTIHAFTSSTSPANGYTAQVQSDTVLHFTLPDHASAKQTVKHTITINAINDGSVAITIASHPIHLTLQVGEKQMVDVDGDGQPDIGVQLVNITEGNVSLKVWKVLEQATLTTPVAKSIQPVQSTNSQRTLYFAGGTVLLVIVAAYFLARLARRSHH